MLAELADTTVIVDMASLVRGCDVRIDTNRERYRVLVVDDFAQAAELVATLVRLIGHDAVAAETARDAIDACTNFAPDLVLLDLGLPDMCGFETARIMKACRPSMRIVAITGRSDAHGAARAREVGIHDYLVKPFNRRHIEALLGSM